MAGELQRLRQAVEDYLALGEDTPVAQEAEALLSAIEGASDGGEMEDEIPVDEEEIVSSRNIPEPSDGGYDGKNMGEAREGALAFLQSRPGQGPPPEGEVPPRKRKRAQGLY